MRRSLSICAVAVLGASTASAQCELQHITPDDVFERNSFGGVDVDGDIAIFSAFSDDEAGDDAGAVYVFRKGSTWAQEQKLVPADIVQMDAFGAHISLSGERFVASSRSGFTGAVYVFEYDGATWVERTKLLPGVIENGDEFGFSVALDGDHLLVTAIGDSEMGENAGAVYAFEYDGADWVLRDKLLAFDGGPHDNFGCSLSMRGNLAVIGARNWDSATEVEVGAAYVYRRSGAHWSHVARLVPGEQAHHPRFGNRVSTDGERIAVAATTFGLNDRGAVYVFRETPRTRKTRKGGALTPLAKPRWVQQAMLEASDASPNDKFGQGLRLDGDLLLVGAPYDYPVGSVYFFHDTGDAWIEGARIEPAITTVGDRFGATLASRGGDVLVGDPSEDYRGIDSGAAYAFSRSTTHYGAAWKGAGGFAPALVVKGCPEVGAPLSLAVTNGLGGASGMIVLGDQASLPYYGGTLLVNPIAITLPHVLGGVPGMPGDGSVETSGSLTDPSLIGTTLYAQALYVDAQAAGGHSTSAGLAIVLR